MKKLLQIILFLLLVALVCTVNAQGFITTWKTDNPGTSNNDQITIPTNGAYSYDYNIYWEDVNDPMVNGSVLNENSTHVITFPYSGTYRIEITGTFPTITFNNQGDKEKILTIEEWGSISWKTMENAFYGCANLTSNATDAPDLSLVNNMFSMFRKASSFNSDLNNWDVSNVDKMHWMFLDATSFNGNIGSWNVSNVTDMSLMFRGADSFNRDISSWITTNVTDMTQMFYSAGSFNGDLSGWNVSMVKYMDEMFEEATAFNGDLSEWNVSSVTSMNNMFYGANAFNQDISGWDVSNVNDFGAQFLFGAYEFDMLNYDNLLINWSQLSLQSSITFSVHTHTRFSSKAVTAKQKIINDYGWSFYDGGQNFAPNALNVSIIGAPAQFNALNGNYDYQDDNGDNDFSSFQWYRADDIQGANKQAIPDATNSSYELTVEDIGKYVSLEVTPNDNFEIGIAVESVFVGPVLEAAPFITTWKTDNAGTSGTNQITIPTNGSLTYDYNIYWENVNDETTNGTASNITGNHTITFPSVGTYSVEITGDFPSIYFNNGGDKNKLISIDQWGTIDWKTMEASFRGCHSFQAYNATDAPFLNSVTTTKNMFYATNFNGDLNNWDVTNISNMSGMFGEDHEFNGNIRDWDVSKVTDMSSMFYIWAGDGVFNSNIQDWNVSKVTDMSYMFQAQRVFNQDLNWDVSSVTNMTSMFAYADSFNGDLSSWNVVNVTNMYRLFNHAISFNSDISNWDVSQVTDMKEMFEEATAFNGDLSEWNVSKVTDFSYMFYGADLFNSNLSEWNVVSATNMELMFSNTDRFNGDISKWDVTNVQNMQVMFSNSSSFNGDLSSWDVSNVTNMNGMFNNIKISTGNYDKLLNAWSLLTLQNSVSLGAGNSTYTSSGSTARQAIIDNFGWAITDGGLTENPAFEATPTAFVEENTVIVYDVNANDGNGGAIDANLTYSITGGADQTAFSINPSTGVISFISTPPDYESAPADTDGDNYYEVEVTAEDGDTNTTTQAITIKIIDANESPEITSPATANVSENNTAIMSVAASDPDAGSTLTYSLSAGADQALFGIDANTGALTFNTASDFEVPADANADNGYEVQVAVSDGVNEVTQDVVVTVTDENDNTPVITSMATTNLTENSTAVLTVTATDQDAGSTLTFSLSGGADQVLFGIDANTGALTFNTAPDFENPVDDNADNAYEVQVAVSDGLSEVTQDVIVTVTDANEPSIITSSASANVSENNTAALTVTATDTDAGSTLTFSLSAGADQALFGIDANTGALTFNAAPDFEVPADANADNGYEVQVAVTDGVNEVTQDVVVTVTDENDNTPVITSSATSNISENSTAALTVTATDADAGSTLTFSLSAGADQALFGIDANTGALTFNASPDFENPADDNMDNAYEVQVAVSDGVNEVTQDVVVTVTDLNDNTPEITSEATADVAENSVAALTVTATDADAGSTLTYSLSAGADQALFSVDANTGALTFNAAPDFEAPTDANADNGYELQVAVTDGVNEVTQDVTITVTNVNENPTVANAIADQNLDEGFATQNVDLSSVFTDNDGDALNFSITDNTATNVVTTAINGSTLTLTEVGVGTATITVTADDGNGGSVNDVFVVNVNAAANNAPTVANAIADQNLDEGFATQDIDLTSVFTDADGDALSYSITDNTATNVVTTAINGSTLTLTEVGVGTATITVTADDGNGGEVSTDFTVNVNPASNAVPTVSNVSFTGTLTVGSQLTGSYTFNDADGDTDSSTYQWYRSDDNAGTNKSAISGATTVAYTLTTSDETKHISFEVTPNDGMVSGDPVESALQGPVPASNTAPTVANAISDQNLDEGFATQNIDLTNVFTDADDDVLTYSVWVSEVGVVTAMISDATLILTEVGVGVATILVSADDGNLGQVSDVFQVSVNATGNNVPTVTNGISDQYLDEGFGTKDIVLGDVFTDADGDELTYSIWKSSNEGVVKPLISGTTLTLTEVGNGTASIAVKANDGNGGEVLDMFTVNINATGNNAPTVVNAIADQNLDEGFATRVIDITNVFTDADGDALNYEVTGNTPTGVVTTSITGSTLTLTEAGTGTATITVTASDGNGGEVSTDFNVNVNPASNAVPTVSNVSFTGTLTVGSQLTGSYTFNDADGDTDNSTYQWYRYDDNAGTNKSAISGATMVTFMLTSGEANKHISFEVTPNDGMVSGDPVESSLQGPVPASNTAPTVANAIADQNLDEGFASQNIDLTNVFTDADGDPLNYEVTGNTPTGVVTTSITGSTLTLTEAGTGTATITVTASDGNGGEVSTDFNVNVNPASNAVPTVSNVSFTGTLEVGSQLTGSYTFNDADGDADNSTYQWYRSDDNAGSNKSAISGATTVTYTLTTSDETKHISFEVTPNDGMVSGESVESALQGPITAPNSAPTVANMISDQNLEANFEAQNIDLGVVFTDRDGDMLSYSLENTATSVVDASIIGRTLTLTYVGIGTATITVTANDGKGGEVSDEFTVIVNAPNSLPVVAIAIADQNLDEGFSPVEIDLSAIFTDADGDVLSYEVTDNTATNVVTTSIAGSTLTLTEAGIGSATVTVTASDGNGGSVADDFIVNVSEVLGLSEEDLVLVYPNPVSGIVTIELPENAKKIGLYNTLGQKVRAVEPVPGSERVEMNLEELGSGTYLMIIETSTSQLRKTVLKRDN